MVSYALLILFNLIWFLWKRRNHSRLTYLIAVALPIITFYYIPCSWEVLRISNIRFYSRIRVNIWAVAVHCCPINYIVPIVQRPLEIKISGRKDFQNQITAANSFFKYLPRIKCWFKGFYTPPLIIFLFTFSDRCNPSSLSHTTNLQHTNEEDKNVFAASSANYPRNFQSLLELECQTNFAPYFVKYKQISCYRKVFFFVWEEKVSYFKILIISNKYYKWFFVTDI